ncbi:MAG: YeeE/YedE family protein [Dehalococcoidia bacterium]
MDILPERLAWYIAGPCIGLCVVALYALINRRMGVTTSYQEVVHAIGRRPVREMWRVWFFGGLAGGALIAVLLQGGPRLTTDYGALGGLLPLAALVPVLFIGGLLSGFGARWSGGCTSGHGISGSSSLSPASIAATMTFVATAVAVTFVIHTLTGGDL